MNVATLLRWMIVAYQWVVSPILGPRCRYLPGCSDYAAEAIARHGAVAGVWLAARRLARCHPWGGHGFDPVPEHLDDRPSLGHHQDHRHESRRACPSARRPHPESS